MLQIKIKKENNERRNRCNITKQNLCYEHWRVIYSLYFVLRSGLKDVVYLPPVFTLSNVHSCCWNSTHATTCQGCLSKEISHKQYRKFNDSYIISSKCKGDAKDKAIQKWIQNKTVAMIIRKAFWASERLGHVTRER